MNDKKSSHLSKDEIEFFKKKLIHEKKQIIIKISEKNELKEGTKGDLCDIASRITINNLIVSKKKLLYSKLVKINNALQRIEDKSYGICKITKKPISIKRLKILPETEYTSSKAIEVEFIKQINKKKSKEIQQS